MITVKHTEYMAPRAADIWAVITDLEHWQWRSDLKNLTIQDKTHFVETDQSGIETAFTVKDVIENGTTMYQWTFSLENANLRGIWQGDIYQDNHFSIVTFQEKVQPKNWLMLPFVKGYLKKQQKKYFTDLKRELVRLNHES